MVNYMNKISTINLLATIEFAIRAHGQQKRKHSGDPYITHPIAVSTILATCSECDVLTLMAGILHDVVEDTDVTQEELVEVFGEEVAEIVHYCTKPEQAQDKTLKREERTAIARAHYIKGCNSAQNIKMADMIHNCKCIIEEDPKFALVYLEEKILLSKQLVKASPVLRDLFYKIYNDWKESLK